KLLAVAPDKFAATNKGVIDGAAQRLPTDSRIYSVEIGYEIVVKLRRQRQAGVVVAARVGSADIEVGGFGDVFVSTQVSDSAHVFALNTFEYVGGIAAEELSGAFKIDPFWPLKTAHNGDAGVVDAV